jgi:hypothetical protein
MPANDVDTALASLETALQARRHGATSRHRLLIALVLSFVLAVLVGIAVTSGSRAAPLAFINLRHQVPGRAASTSWESGGTLQGAAESVLASALREQRIDSLASLEEKRVRRLFVGAGTQPTQAALRAATDASVALLGDIQCAQIEGEAVEGPKTVRSALRLESFRVESGQPLGREEAEGVATDENLARACDMAAAAAMTNLAERMARQLAGQLGAARP